MTIDRRQMMIGTAAGLAAMGAPKFLFAQDGAGMSSLGVRYQKKPEINGGKPIKLTYWEWLGHRADYEKKWAAVYKEMYPNVDIEVVLTPWDNYWAALTTNIPAGSGPSLYHMHVARASEFCEGGLMAPMPDSVADQKFLDQHWVGFQEGAMDCPGMGTRHYLPMGSMLPMVFINTDMWKEAGLAEADMPETWDQFRQVATKLTKRDGRGRIVVAGVNMIRDGQEWLQNAVYQQGRYLFTADGKKAQIANPEYKKAVQFIADLVHVDKALDPELSQLEWQSFVGKRSAMFLGFSWVVGAVKQNAKDMNWVGIPMPTPAGKFEPAYGNHRFAVEAVVNPNTAPEEQTVAWDFWHFAYSRDEAVLKDIALSNGFLPPYDELLDAPEVKADQVANALAPTVEYGIINDLPEVVRLEQDQLLGAIMLDPSDIDGKLQEAEERTNAQLAQREDWNIIERNYKHHDLMIPDQP